MSSMPIIEGSYLSHQQQRWFEIKQRLPTTANLLSTCLIGIEGALDVQALRDAVEGTFRRFQIFQTTLSTCELPGVPLQVIRPGGVRWLEPVDWSDLTRTQQRANLDALYDHLETLDFDLAQNPFPRACVASLGECNHALLLAFPSFQCDLSGTAQLVRALAAAYGQPEERQSPEDTLQYAAFASWQNEWLQSQGTGSAEAVCKGFDLVDMSRVRLPFERCSQGQFALASTWQEIPNVLANGVRDYAKRSGCSVSSVWLAAWQTLFWRLTDARDILVGITCDGRSDPDLQEAIGLFASVMPLCAQLDENTSFSSLVTTAEERAAALRRHQDTFTWNEVSLSSKRAEPLYCPFVWEHLSLPEDPFAGPVRFRLDRACSHIDQFRLKATILERPEGPTLGLSYDASVFESNALEGLVNQYLRALESACVNPVARISRVSLTSESERRRVLFEFNDTGSKPGLPGTIAHSFIEQCQRTPERVAVTWETGSITYKELDRKTNLLAWRLREQCFGPDSIAAICIERSIEMVVGIMAILKAGGAYLPVDPEYPPDRVKHVLEDSRAAVLLTRGNAPPGLSNNPARRVMEIGNLDSWQDCPQSPPTGCGPDNLAYIIYTSGSTGKPKGVMISHRSIGNRLAWMQREFPLQQDDRILQKTAFSFDASVWEILLPLLSGTQLVLAKPDGERDTHYLVRSLAQQKVTVLQVVPSLLEALLDEPELALCTQLRRVFCGGEALQTDAVQRLQALLPVEVVNLYGPTETAIDATYCRFGRNISPSVVPLGRPISNTAAHVLDDDFDLTPVGAAGELHIAGWGLARGYLHNPSLTAERFVPNPFATGPGARLYRTGDRVRQRHDGVIEFLGRIDNQVKLRGFRIELNEIDASLKRHPVVRDAASVTHREPDGSARIVSFVAAKNRTRVSEVDISAFLRQTLPHYMIPSSFVLVPELPRLANGKLDRHKLASLSIVRRSEAQEPRDVVQLQLVRIWEQLLGRRPIGTNESFFDLGGHSMLAVRLMSRIQKHFGQNLPISALFERPTIQDLATLLERGSPVRSPVIPIQPRGSRPPLFCVHPSGGGVLCYSELSLELGTDQPFFGIEDPALEGAEPFRSVEAMARHYAAAMRQIRPEGPYALAGYSSGGTIAFEMAQQLSRDGHEVPLLILLDSTSPATRRQFDLEARLVGDDSLLLAFILHGQARAKRRQLPFRPSELAALETHERMRLVVKCAHELELWPQEIGVEQAERHLNLRRTGMYAIQAYTPSMYAERVALLRTGELDFADIHDMRALFDEEFLRGHIAEEIELFARPQLGWERYCSKSLSVETVPGNHHTFLAVPNVSHTAAKLERLLRAGY